ncbi:cupin [Sphingorhabdus sp. Alg239-R122]|uniref:cupin n=1 Tax=Sphingorhabdus sp. Alg239-R122 TaxID=2305989 RepID=UPI0013DA26B1|nr:cupin [Sphingorhabdus sp. Alg239-R122]
MPEKLQKNPIHLGLGATAIVQPEMTGDMSWYAGYVERHGEDGHEGRLVSMYRFTESWDVWEMHPKGNEVVLCTEGRMVLVQEMPDGSEKRTALEAGEYAINDCGIWHTADVEREATAVFVTAGEGTEHRERK